MQVVNIYQAKTNLSALVQRASEGEEIIIARNGKPVARLVPLPVRAARRSPGAWKGRVWIAPDFDDADTTLEALLMGESTEP